MQKHRLWFFHHVAGGRHSENSENLGLWKTVPEHKGFLGSFRNGPELKRLASRWFLDFQKVDSFRKKPPPKILTQKRTLDRILKI